MTKAQETQARYANQHRREVTFLAGQKVLLSTEDLNLKALGQSKKLLPKFIGPFTVSRVISDNAYKLSLPPQYRRLHPVFNVSRLRAYHESDPSKFPAARSTIDRCPSWRRRRTAMKLSQCWINAVSAPLTAALSIGTWSSGRVTRRATRLGSPPRTCGPRMPARLFGVTSSRRTTRRTPPPLVSRPPSRLVAIPSQSHADDGVLLGRGGCKDARRHCAAAPPSATFRHAPRAVRRDRHPCPAS